MLINIENKLFFFYKKRKWKINFQERKRGGPKHTIETFNDTWELFLWEVLMQYFLQNIIAEENNQNQIPGFVKIMKLKSLKGFW